METLVALLLMAAIPGGIALLVWLRRDRGRARDRGDAMLQRTEPPAGGLVADPAFVAALAAGTSAGAMLGGVEAPAGGGDPGGASGDGAGDGGGGGGDGGSGGGGDGGGGGE